ncbi:MAG TPA: helix-turn-helix domain-containing protein, partial [Gammaproteobacteria bacterium]|nr:helix-turn-helix domain-containing protein [Gammaproteobacteria bacterium]
YLLRHTREPGRRELHLTHQAIADDLGTSREVVSRVLKDLEQRGLLRLARGRIGIDDPQGLELALAQCD